MWKTVSFRRHELKKVYCNDGEGIDLILIGALTIHKDAGHDLHEFVARCLLDTSDIGSPKIKHYQVLIPASNGPYIPFLSKEAH